MQQPNLNNNPAQGIPYDRNLVDIERRIFNEPLDTTRRIHQIGYDDLMRLRNANNNEANSTEFKSLFKSKPPLNENDLNHLNECEFQENISRYFKGPYQGNEYPSITTTHVNGNIEQNINGPYPSTSTAPDQFIRNYDQNQCCPPCPIDKPGCTIKPLKSILRNPVFRPDIENNQDYMKSRQVSFESQSVMRPSNSLIFSHISTSRVPGQMEWTPQCSLNDTNPMQNYSHAIPSGANLQFSSLQHLPTNTENDPFKYSYLNINSHSIPEEISQTSYVNDPNHHITSYKYYNYNDKYNPIDLRNTMSKTNTLTDNVFQRSHEQVPAMQQNSQGIYQNLNQQEIPNSAIKSPYSSANYNLNQYDKPPDKYMNVPTSGSSKDDSFLQPRTQQPDTVPLRKELINIHPQTVHSSQPCYAIPADMAYFHYDRFELFVDAKLLIPERIRVNILPERVELYGCTEYNSVGCKSLLEIIRIYDLPARVSPERTTCVLNAEGILFIMAAWENPL